MRRSDSAGHIQRGSNHWIAAVRATVNVELAKAANDVAAVDRFDVSHVSISLG